MKFKDFIYFYPENPMLVHRDQKLVEEMSNDSNFVAEPKYNGSRCQLHILNGNPQYWTRHGEPFKFKNFDTYKMKEELNRFIPKKGYYLFDAEMRHNKVEGIRNKIVIFDCFIYNNLFLNRHTFAERRKLIEELNLSIYNGDDLHLIYQYKDNFKRHFDSFIAGNYGDPDEFEGMVIKDLTGKLNLSRVNNQQSRWMFKIRKETGRHKF